MEDKFVDLNLKFNEEIDKKYIHSNILSIKDMQGNTVTSYVKIENKKILNIKLKVHKESLGKEYILQFKECIYSTKGNKLEGLNNIKFCLGQEKVQNNGNRVVKQGNWIYYSGNKKIYTYIGYNTHGEIKKISLDGSLDIKLCEDFASKIWIDDKWLYYINYKGEQEENCLYRIKKDGTGKEKITDNDVTSLAFSEEYIFYSEYVSSSSKDNYRIYRIYKDGTNKISLNNKKGINFITQGPFLYYLNIEDNYSIYRIRIDGLDNKKLNNFSSKSFMKIKDDWIYYINDEYNNNLYRITLDGSYEEKLSNDNCTNAVIEGEYIYYCNNLDFNKTYLYRININGLERQKLCEEDCSRQIVSYEDYIFFVGNNKKGIHKIRNDGTNHSILTEDDALGLDIIHSFIYYYKLNLKGLSMELHRISIDSNKKQLVI